MAKPGEEMNHETAIDQVSYFYNQVSLLSSSAKVEGGYRKTLFRLSVHPANLQSILEVKPLNSFLPNFQDMFYANESSN